MNNLYVYVDGCDLANVSDNLEKEFKYFLSIWNVSGSKFINQQFPRTPDLSPEDYPEWNLGINIKFEKLPSEKIDELVSFLNTLSSNTDREFVIGYYDSECGISEDWCFVGKEYKKDSV